MSILEYAQRLNLWPRVASAHRYQGNLIFPGQFFASLLFKQKRFPGFYSQDRDSRRRPAGPEKLGESNPFARTVPGDSPTVTQRLRGVTPSAG